MKPLFIALFAFVVTFSVKASCDIQIHKETVIKALSAPMPIVGGGVGLPSNIRYPDYPFTVKGESFVLVLLDVTLTTREQSPHKKQLMMLWPVDLASCTLGHFDSGDVFGTSVSN